MITVTQGKGLDCNGIPFSGGFISGEIVIEGDSYKVATAKQLHDVCFLNGQYDGGLMVKMQNLIIENILTTRKGQPK